MVNLFDKVIHPDSDPFVVAEISGNHNGSLTRLKDLIKLAAQSGADAVKIQSYVPHSLTIDCNSDDFIIKEGLWVGQSLFQLYSIAQTPFEWHREIFDFAKSESILLISSPFDLEAVDLLQSCDCPAYKIASFEIQDLSLIQKVANTMKPVIISTGMADLEDIARAVNLIESCGNTNIVILHCISSYPAPPADSNIKTIQHLAQAFGYPVGLSDHTLGTAVAVTSVALGACFIEKHFTDSRAKGGVDSQFSIEPNELSMLKRDTLYAKQCLGTVKYGSADSEKENQKFRRSLYFVASIREGEIIREDHVRAIRPGYGMPPYYLKSVIGRTASKDFSPGDRVSFEDFEALKC